MAYVRGCPKDYESWADKGADGWSYKDVLPFFKKSENCRFKDSADHPCDSDLHGYDGPLHTCVRKPVNEMASAFVTTVGHSCQLILV